MSPHTRLLHDRRPAHRPVLRSVALVLLALLALTGPLTAPSSAASTPRTLTAESFGAKGDETTDDTDALRRAIAALQPGDRLALGTGRTYRHSGVLTVRTSDVRIYGTGTLLATDEAASLVGVEADRVEIDDVTFAIRSTTRRWGTFDQMKLLLGQRTGVVLRRVTVDGSAAAGIYLWGTSNFLLDHVTVRNTRADGIHITGPSHDGSVVAPVVERSGDDGVAVVSYVSDKIPVHDVTIDGPTVRTTTWGRGVSVVGGTNITYKNVFVSSSSAAAVYVASEGDPWNTFAPVHVKVLGATLRSSNTTASVDHGAVLVYSGHPGYPPSDVTLDKFTISDTRKTASSQVGLRADEGCTMSQVVLSNFNISGGGTPSFAANVVSSSYTRSGRQTT